MLKVRAFFLHIRSSSAEDPVPLIFARVSRAPRHWGAVY
jgi:hypothetical protein